MNRENCSEAKPSSTSAPAATKRELGTPIVFVADSTGKAITFISDRTGREITLCGQRQPGPG